MTATPAASGASTIEKLATWLHALGFDALAPRTKARALQCVVDAVACAAAGHSHPAARRARAWATQALPGADARAWFDGGALSVLGAAFSHAAATSVLDLDDGHRAASGHPGAAVVPALLTLAQGVDASLEQVLEAVVVGYEVGVRMARGRDPVTQQSVASGRWTAVAVAAGAARLLGLPAMAMAHAIATAESLAPNLLAADHAGFAGSDVKEGIAWSVVTGLAAAQQAAAGAKGYLNALDNGTVYRPGLLAHRHDAPWLIESTYFKPYACCRWIHAAIDAALQWRELAPDAVSPIEAVEIRTFGRALSLANQCAPTDLISAQFSLPFCVALALLEGAEPLQRLCESDLQRQDVQRLAMRIALRQDERLDAMFPQRVPARLRIRSGGTWREWEVLAPCGDPDAPMSRAQFEDKLSRLLGKAASQPLRNEAVPLIFGARDWTAAALEGAQAALQRSLSPRTADAMPAHARICTPAWQ